MNISDYYNPDESREMMNLGLANPTAWWRIEKHEVSGIGYVPKSSNLVHYEDVPLPSQWPKDVTFHPAVKRS